jgi:hypothetical protein
MLACPAWLETVTGTFTCGSLLASASAMGVAVCPEFNVTLQLSGEPDCNVAGAQANPTGLTPIKERFVCADEVPRLAMNCAFSSWSMRELVAMNGADVLPAGGCTNDGTVTCVLLEDS